jgi:hypothetical protein
MNCSSFIACGRQIYLVEDIILMNWKERLLAERWERKAGYIRSMLEQCNYHWEEVFWWLLARNFGLQVNAEAFEELARSVPYNILLRHRYNTKQTEAILLGQAGLLESAEQMKEYNFLATKYGLQKIAVPFHSLRMRPAAFPVQRIKQLASIISKPESSFSFILNTEDIRQLKSAFPATVIINTVIPILYTYAQCRGEEKYIERAADLIHIIPSEKNSITLQFKKLDIKSRSAADSQALIELKMQYCDRRRCLDCAVGNAIFKRKI